LTLPDHVAVQLNDTHPALAVAELMRLLVDEYLVSWREAWQITTTVLNYTNHTLLPEALETWPLALMNHLLPRHTQIIFLINWLHLKRVADISHGDPVRLEAASLIDESGERRVRMGHLVFVGSHKINGVSALHTDLMRNTVFSDLDAVYPGRIVNKTNGIDFRRWLFQANPRLAHLIIEARGGRVRTDFEQLKTLESLLGDGSFLDRLAAARHANKVDLCEIVREQTGIRLDPHALFDVHVKRFHEYKRQLLNLLETIALFHSIRARPDGDFVPRVKVFAGKAAMTYAQAKLIIKLVNDVASVVNNDPVVGDRLKVVFIPNYGVSLAEAIIPAADVSEQISTAGLEASGTGNMKFALNGALTIGTLDGANIEIRENVGSENMCIFGMDAPEVAAMRHAGLAGRDAAHRSPLLAETIASLSSGLFSPDDKGRFAPIVEALLGRDEFMVAADFDSYWRAQRSIDERWRDQDSWWRTSLINTARMSWFSSDRAVREYAAEIWRVPVDAESQAR
jgi:starch phosphorylase